ncbi:MAG: CAP domain-containing protein [Clostridiaceae bacterium]|nr:CAP domain-containing protein [Clostridiaceae bacterium]
MKKLLSVLLVLLLLTLPVVTTTVATATAAATDLEAFWTAQEWAVLRLTNIERMNRNLAPLTFTADALNAARIRCGELESVVGHTRPDGRDCFSVLTDLDIDASYAGENVAAGQSDAYDVMQAWMGSEGHRANILNDGFSHLGAAYLPGSLGESYRSYWTQIFFDDYCRFSSLRLIDAENLVVTPGTSIDDMRVIAEAECAVHGKSYLPVISQMCFGYDPDVTGEQTVTVTFRNLSATFTVEVREDASTSTPPVSSSDTIAVFQPVSDYYYLFDDVSDGAWYYDDVYLSVIYGLVRGVTSAEFKPDDALTVAQTLMIAARIRNLYDGGSGNISQEGATWYSGAVTYCVEQGIIATDAFADFTRPATRAEVAGILAHTLPGTELNAIRKIDSISDVSADAPYADEIFSLYRAGILIGDETGAFHGNQSIRRCEAAAVLVRLILPAQRIG